MKSEFEDTNGPLVSHTSWSLRAPATAGVPPWRNIASQVFGRLDAVDEANALRELHLAHLDITGRNLWVCVRRQGFDEVEEEITHKDGWYELMVPRREPPANAIDVERPFALLVGELSSDEITGQAMRVVVRRGEVWESLSVEAVLSDDLPERIEAEQLVLLTARACLERRGSAPRGWPVTAVRAQSDGDRKWRLQLDVRAQDTDPGPMTSWLNATVRDLGAPVGRVEISVCV